MSSTVERDRTPARPYQQTEQFLEHSNKRAPKTYQISSRADYESSTPTDGPRDMASAAVPIATAVASVAVPLVIEKLQQKFSRGKKFSAKKKPGTTSRGRGDYVDSNSDDVLDTSCVDVERALSDFRQIMLKSTIAQTLSAPHRALLADPSAFSSATDLYHFLYAAYARCLRIKESHSAQPTERSCALCARNSPSYDHALAKCKEFFYANASLTKILLVTVFQCPSILANELMRIVKPPVDPSEGLYAWDVWTIVKEHAKKLNDLIPAHRTFVHGVLYKESTPPEMLDYYAHAALRMDADWNRHCFLYATGSVQHPKHWCLLFLDSRSRTYIHFNSLGGRETQTSDPLYQALCRVGGPLNFLTNASRLQGSSKLCGFYVYHMFDRLARCESEFLADFFESTTGAKKNWSDSSIASAVPSRLAAPTNPFSNLIDHIPGLDF